METRNMKNRPFHIKAVLFRLEPTPDLLTASHYLISKDLQLGIVSYSDVNTTRQKLRDCGFVNKADMVTPDGMPLVWTGKLHGKSTIGRTYSISITKKDACN